MKNKRPGILIIGPITAKGGISSVIHAIMNTGVLQKEYDIWQVNTSLYKEGNKLQEGVTFLVAVWKMFVLMVFKRRISVVHIHASSGVSFFRKVIFFLIAKNFRKRIIFHIHASQFNAFYIANNSVLIQKIKRFVFESCDAIIVLANIWKNALENHFALNKKVFVIRNPVLQSSSGNGAYNVRDERRKKKRNILFMGFLIKNKGIYDLITAIPYVVYAFPNVKFVLCGKGDEEITIRKRIHDLKLTDYVVMPGWVENHEKGRHLQRADIFVLPSYCEGMPMALLEAMAAGLPIVATKVGAVPEVIKEGKNGLLVESGKPEDLADRIIKLLGNQTLREKMRVENKRLAEKFNAKAIAEYWKRLYDSLINQGEPKFGR